MAVPGEKIRPAFEFSYRAVAHHIDAARALMASVKLPIEMTITYLECGDIYIYVCDHVGVHFLPFYQVVMAIADQFDERKPTAQ